VTGFGKDGTVQTYAIVAAEPQPETPTNGGQTPQAPCGWETMVLFGAMMVVFYLLLIRPQQKKQKEAERRKKEMLENLKRNDHVMTIGGIHGVVMNVADDGVILRIDDKSGTTLRVTRDAISQVITDEGEGKGADESKK